MGFLFAHLPEEVFARIKGDSELLVNSLSCLKYKDKPCKKTGRCCLGCDQTCTHNTCQNSKVRAALKEGQM